MGKVACCKGFRLAGHTNILTLLEVTREANLNRKNYRATLYYNLQNYRTRISYPSVRVESRSELKSRNAQASD